MLPPGFVTAPHNHDLWSVVGPGVITNDAGVIYCIRNPLDTPFDRQEVGAG